MKIKQVPEDFKVEELFDLSLSGKGSYTYFKLWKRNYTTIKALETVAERFKIPFKKFSFAGNKDSRAETTQYCSMLGKIKSWKGKDIFIKVIGHGNMYISLGDHKGNRFEIVVRGIEKKPKPIKKFVNYYGPQRFSKNNVEIGRAIIKRDFKKALLLADNPDSNEYIKTYPQNFIGGLRKIPKNLLRLYIHSYQSYLWNKGVKKLIKKLPVKCTSFPIFGFGTEIRDKAIKKIVSGINKKEYISERNFIIREIPELSSEGGEREIFTTVRNLKMGNLTQDELNKGKKKLTLTFELEKGSYATEFIMHLFS